MHLYNFSLDEPAVEFDVPTDELRRLIDLSGPVNDQELMVGIGKLYNETLGAPGGHVITALSTFFYFMRGAYENDEIENLYQGLEGCRGIVYGTYGQDGLFEFCESEEKYVAERDKHAVFENIAGRA